MEIIWKVLIEASLSSLVPARIQPFPCLLAVLISSVPSSLPYTRLTTPGSSGTHEWQLSKEPCSPEQPCPDTHPSYISLQALACLQRLHCCSVSFSWILTPPTSQVCKLSLLHQVTPPQSITSVSWGVPMDSATHYMTYPFQTRCSWERWAVFAIDGSRADGTLWFISIHSPSYDQMYLLGKGKQQKKSKQKTSWTADEGRGVWVVTETSYNVHETYCNRIKARSCLYPHSTKKMSFTTNKKVPTWDNLE